MDGVLSMPELSAYLELTEGRGKALSEPVFRWLLKEFGSSHAAGQSPMAEPTSGDSGDGASTAEERPPAEGGAAAAPPSSSQGSIGHPAAEGLDEAAFRRCYRFLCVTEHEPRRHQRPILCRVENDLLSPTPVLCSFFTRNCVCRFGPSTMMPLLLRSVSVTAEPTTEI